MNKKLVKALAICAALLAVLLVVMIALIPHVSQPDVENPGTTGAQLSANGETEAFGTEGSAVTDPSGESKGTEPETDDETRPSNPDDTAEETTLPTTPDKSTEETTLPTTPTIPPENVDMGVVEGEEGGDFPDGTGNAERPTQGTEPNHTTPPTENSNTNGNVLGENFDITTLTYEKFMAMNGEQQRAVIGLFGSPEDFMTWYKAVEAIYKAEHPDIEIGGDGNVNVGG